MTCWSDTLIDTFRQTGEAAYLDAIDMVSDPADRLAGVVADAAGGLDFAVPNDCTRTNVRRTTWVPWADLNLPRSRTWPGARRPPDHQLGSSVNRPPSVRQASVKRPLSVRWWCIDQP